MRSLLLATPGVSPEIRHRNQLTAKAWEKTGTRQYSMYSVRQNNDPYYYDFINIISMLFVQSVYTQGIFKSKFCFGIQKAAMFYYINKGIFFK